MSYEKAMKHARNPRINRKTQPIVMGFVDTNRDYPSLGGYWFEPGRDAEREQFVKAWRRERGFVCYGCDETNDLTPYRMMNIGTGKKYQLCPKCQTDRQIQKIKSAIMQDIDELEAIGSDNRRKKRIDFLKNSISEQRKAYLLIAGVELNVQIDQQMSFIL